MRQFGHSRPAPTEKRHSHWYLMALLAILFCRIAASSSNAAEPVENPYRLQIREKLLSAEKAKQIVLKGNADWLFFTPELRAITVGSFWGGNAVSVSRATNPKFADPLGPIIDFHEQLKREGIELLVVPVPAKASISPEFLISGFEQELNLGRIDAAHALFYKTLEERGIKVLDLHSDFVKQRPAGLMYCKTDSHWSGQGVKVAAEAIADRVKASPFLTSVGSELKLDPNSIDIKSKKLEITGDLAQLANEKNPSHETIDVIEVFVRTTAKEQAIPLAAASPVLLLGDSHTLVFHDPALFTTGCGLADHLARALKIKLDLIGVRGSGANAARISWRRRPNPLAGKKLVIWCFSIREFTENTDGWKNIPVKSAK